MSVRIVNCSPMCLRKPWEGFWQEIEIFIFKCLEASLLLLCKPLAIGRVGRETELLRGFR